MPIYEYKCKICGHQFSHLHKRLGESAPPCPSCQGEQIEKLLSSFSAGVSSGPSQSCSITNSCPAPSSCAGGACPFG
ncbi:MAG: zinc ribbon domain-containing protein [Lentisphaerae bacterium]|nr:zinc ribbon domain-containing protein [Lentisphaerota bacterium]